jgi:hypothetical protein
VCVLRKWRTAGALIVQLSDAETKTVAFVWRQPNCRYAAQRHGEVASSYSAGQRPARRAYRSLFNSRSTATPSASSCPDGSDDLVSMTATSRMEVRAALGGDWPPCSVTVRIRKDATWSRGVVVRHPPGSFPIRIVDTCGKSLSPLLPS